MYKQLTRLWYINDMISVTLIGFYLVYNILSPDVIIYVTVTALISVCISCVIYKNNYVLIYHATGLLFSLIPWLIFSIMDTHNDDGAKHIQFSIIYLAPRIIINFYILMEI